LVFYENVGNDRTEMRIYNENNENEEMTPAIEMEVEYATNIDVENEEAGEKYVNIIFNSK
jgi:hypothetical protein